MAFDDLDQDWSLIQSFLAVAETGSLSAAARLLSRSQPTLGRHIKTLERALSATLFDRHPKGLSLTAAGAELLPLARQMRETMSEIAIRTAGRDSRLAGTVRVTSSVFVAHYVLPGILARIRQAEPQIQIDLVPSDDSENLLFRQADLAVRMYEPEQLDIVCQHVCDTEIAAFAAHSYIERAGWPETAEDLRQHDLIGYDRSDLMLRTMADLGISGDREMFAIRCDNQSAYWELVRAGCGVGFSQAIVGRNDPSVTELHLGIDVPALPVWLAAHQAMRQTPRIRKVWDMLFDELRSMMA